MLELISTAVATCTCMSSERLFLDGSGYHTGNLQTTGVVWENKEAYR